MPILESAILDSLENLFEIFEVEAYKVVCSKQNIAKFADLIGRALKEYKEKVMQKTSRAQAGNIPCKWVLPEVRDYKDNTYREVEEIKNHALLPYYELNKVSMPEQRFTDFLEENSEHIEWWYKNGDSGSEHFAIQYTNSQGKAALFYVDFIIKMKNGKVFLFDTKSENSDSEAPNKHNALIDYINEEWNADKTVQGGIIIEKNMNWQYSPFKIENTTNLSGWSSFYPANV